MNEKLKNLLQRGVAEVIVKEHLEMALESGRPLRVKFGVDPTSSDLHLGHSVVFRKLRQFQELGHKIIFIIGDYTARVGDPSGRSKTRPALTEKEIEAHAETYLNQASRFLDIAAAEIHHNSEWFVGQDWVLPLAGRFTAQRIIERDDFAKRFKDGTEVYMHELLYPMMQAYDSVQIKTDVELGGTDQKFNMLAGRDLQRHMGLPEQDVLTLPLLRGLDGVHKMSKSLGNYVGVTESPEVMFGKIMSVPDVLIDEYYELCTDVARAEADPRLAKLELAKIIVDIYHGVGEGEKARLEFVRVFSKKEKPRDIPEIAIGAGALTLVGVLVAAKLAKSKTEARRLIEQGAVKLDDVKQSDPEAKLDLTKGVLVQVGPRKFARLGH